MRSLQILRQQVEVFHRGADLRVPEDDREPHDIAAVLQVLGREGVTQPMESRAWQAKSLQQAVVASQRIALLPPAALPRREHQVRVDPCSILDLSKSKQH